MVGMMHLLYSCPMLRFIRTLLLFQTLLICSLGTAEAKKTARDLELKCQRGNQDACYEHAWFTYLGARGAREDPDRAVPILRRGCDAGSKKACYWLGRANLDGKGTAQDNAQAYRLFSASCDRGHMRSCYRAGRMLKNGQATDPSTSADRLLGKACTHNVSEACSEQGLAKFFDNDIDILLAGGIGPDGTFANRQLYQGTRAGGNTWSLYSEFEGYRVLIFPIGAAVRVGARYRYLTPRFDLGVYACSGPVVGAGLVGWDANSRLKARLLNLPHVEGGAKYSHAMLNGQLMSYMEWRAVIRTGPWGEFLAEKLGFALEYGRRQGLLWSDAFLSDQNVLFEMAIKI